MSNDLPTNLILKPQGEFMDSTTKEKKPVYSIQADNSCDLDTLLSAMGMCMETLLTNPQMNLSSTIRIVVLSLMNHLVILITMHLMGTFIEITVGLL